MSTTPAIIRGSIASRIAALVPTLHAGDRFREYTYEDSFREWAAAHPTDCLRRFTVAESPSIQLPDVTDGLVEMVRQEFTVEVAYPALGARFGRHRLGTAEAISIDRSQISKTVGTNGQAGLALTTTSATVVTVEEARDDAGPVAFGVVRLLAHYYRSAAP